MVHREIYRPQVEAGAPRVRDERSLGELFGDLLQESQTLLRQEVALAKSEINQKVSKASAGLTYAMIGGAIAYAGFLAIVFAAIALLGLFISVWLSALIVGVVVAIIGYFILQKGLDDLKPKELTPQQTIQSVKETAEWAKEQI